MYKPLRYNIKIAIFEQEINNLWKSEQRLNN